MPRGAGRRNRTAGVFGSVDKLATGYRARYYGPDGQRHKAPVLFSTKAQARAWLSQRHSEIIDNVWQRPRATNRLTFADYANDWLARRQLKTSTREHYQGLLDQHLMPAFGHAALTTITAGDIRTWYAEVPASTPTRRAHAYVLLRTILGSAASDGHIDANPCAIRGAGSVGRVHQIRPATTKEIEKIAGAMPPQYAAMVLLASWCALRFGELTELRRKDVVLDPDHGVGVVRVQRAAVRTAGGYQVTTPKSDAGIRDVAIPPHLVPVIAEHMAAHVGPKADALLFASPHDRHLPAPTLHGYFRTARKSAGRPDMRFHDLRHSGAVLAAQTGATLSELMGRLGHSTPAMAMRYQHVAAGRDQQIAEALSRMRNDG